jgi:hypothetical protein
MPSAARRATIVASIGLLVAAVVFTAVRLAHVDPRAREAWSASTSVITADGMHVDLFLPACAVRAVLVRGEAPPGTVLYAEVRSAGSHGSVLQAARLLLASADGFRVPLDTSPWRVPVRLRLWAPGRTVTLDDTRPFLLERENPSMLGVLPCAFDGGSPTMTWALGILMLLGTAGTGWLAAHLWDGRPPLLSVRQGPAMAALLTAATALTYVLVVPPFEPPDELAHLQYARFVAVTGTLPREVPPHDSQWRASSYEWVQQPLYYLAAGGVLRVLGLHEPAPAPRLNPRSRLTGGSEVSIFAHDGAPAPRAPSRALYLLRLLSVAMAAATAWCAARATALVTGSHWIGTLAGAGLALVPQWAAVMGIVSTDPPATLLAAMTTLLLCTSIAGQGRDRAWLMAGLLAGAAYATKATTVFLLPMGLLAAWSAARGVRSAFVRRAAWFAAGAAAVAAWIPLRAWLVFGDPLARAFKQEVLEAGGFVVTEGPPLLSRAFADQLRTMVFEPFWARFGSLGAGPLPGTRIWWLYGAATGALVLALAGGLAASIMTREVRRRRLLRIQALGVVVGLTLWAWVNLVPQADMVVHWTPRHILPLTVPLLVLVAAGLQHVAGQMPMPARLLLRRSAAVGMLLLSVASLAVLRSVILGFHFGF